jgi:hypothetical protein
LITAPAPPLNTVTCLSWGHSSNVNMPVKPQKQEAGIQGASGRKSEACPDVRSAFERAATT